MRLFLTGHTPFMHLLHLPTIDHIPILNKCQTNPNPTCPGRACGLWPALCEVSAVFYCTWPGGDDECPRHPQAGRHAARSLGLGFAHMRMSHVFRESLHVFRAITVVAFRSAIFELTPHPPVNATSARSAHDDGECFATVCVDVCVCNLCWQSARASHE